MAGGRLGQISCNKHLWIYLNWPVTCKKSAYLQLAETCVAWLQLDEPWCPPWVIVSENQFSVFFFLPSQNTKWKAKNTLGGEAKEWGQKEGGGLSGLWDQGRIQALVLVFSSLVKWFSRWIVFSFLSWMRFTGAWRERERKRGKRRDAPLSLHPVCSPLCPLWAYNTEWIYNVGQTSFIRVEQMNSNILFFTPKASRTKSSQAVKDVLYAN